jgi:hypothetical protein
MALSETVYGVGSAAVGRSTSLPPVRPFPSPYKRGTGGNAVGNHLENLQRSPCEMIPMRNDPDTERQFARPERRTL